MEKQEIQLTATSGNGSYELRSTSPPLGIAFLSSVGFWNNRRSKLLMEEIWRSPPDMQETLQIMGYLPIYHINRCRISSINRISSIIFEFCVRFFCRKSGRFITSPVHSEANSCCSRSPFATAAKLYRIWEGRWMINPKYSWKRYRICV